MAHLFVDGTKIENTFFDNPNFKVQRKPPLVYKESGEKRLYAYNDKLVQIVPSNPWTILTYEIEKSDSEKTGKVMLNLIRLIPLPWVELSAIGQLFCADQQGPHLVLAFFTEKQGLDTYSSKIVTLDMASTSSLHSVLIFLFKNLSFQKEIIMSHLLLKKLMIFFPAQGSKMG